MRRRGYFLNACHSFSPTIIPVRLPDKHDSSFYLRLSNCLILSTLFIHARSARPPQRKKQRNKRTNPENTNKSSRPQAESTANFSTSFPTVNTVGFQANLTLWRSCTVVARSFRSSPTLVLSPAIKKKSISISMYQE
jgi:hypothetical protein